MKKFLIQFGLNLFILLVVRLIIGHSRLALAEEIIYGFMIAGIMALLHIKLREWLARKYPESFPKG